MRTSINTIILEDCEGYSPTTEGVSYTDITGTKIFIPMKLLIRLFDGTKDHLERTGVDWEVFVKNIFENR